MPSISSVVEHRDDPGLVFEPGPLFGAGQERRVQQFDRDFPVQRKLDGFEDHPHAAAAELADEAVIGIGQIGPPGHRLFWGNYLRLGGPEPVHIQHQIEEAPELFGVFRMFRKKSLGSQRLPGLPSLQKLRGDLFERSSVAHGRNSVYSASFCRSRSSART